VTAVGRSLIERTKELVEAHFVVRNGYAGDATVIYGDTDSVMINFQAGNSIARAFELGREAAVLATKHFPAPIKLEFEKVYCPYMLFSKKRYAGLLYASNATSSDYTDVKGFQSVRRDNCLLLRETLDQCLQLLLHQRDVSGAVEVVQDMLRTLLSRNTPLHKLILTKQLRKVAYKIMPPHLALVKRLQARDAASAPVVGDRIPFVVVETCAQTAQTTPHSLLSASASPASTSLSATIPAAKGTVDSHVVAACTATATAARPVPVSAATAAVSAVHPPATSAVGRKVNAKASGNNLEDPLYVMDGVCCDGLVVSILSENLWKEIPVHVFLCIFCFYTEPFLDHCLSIIYGVYIYIYIYVCVCVCVCV
jgi:hypothetical protein